MSKRTRLRGKFVIGFDGKQHIVYEEGEVVYEKDTVIFVGHDFSGQVDETWDTGLSIISPGFIDLDACIDTDHAILDVMFFKKNPKPETTWQPGKKYRTVDPFADEEFATRQEYSLVQCIMNGITTVMPIAGEQFHGWGQSYREFEIMAETVKKMGIRAYLGPSFRSNPDREMPRDLNREEKSFQDAIRFFNEYDDTSNGLIKSFLNPCQIAVTDPNILRSAKDFAVEMGAPMRLHACEEDIEWKYMIPKYGKTTIEFFEDIGLLCPQLLIPHAITLKNSEIKKLSDYGVTVIHTPIAEANYGAALNSFAKYKYLGVNIAIATDAQPVDMIQNMRLAWTIDRICEWHILFTKYEEDGNMVDMLADENNYPKISAIDIFNAATINAANALGRNDIGILAENAKADIIVINLDDLRVGPYEDPIRTLLISCVGNNVRHTIINGETKMKDWKIIGLNEKELAIQSQKVYEKYLSLFQEYDLFNRPLSTFCEPSTPIMKKATR